MFNPKETLLDEQLSVSGLEMQFIMDFLTGGASTRNETAKKNEEAAKQHQEKIAKITNRHNRKLDAADKQNYYAMRDFTHESNLRNWERGKEIQDFQYLSQMQQYQKSHAIGNAQLGLNAEAMALGIQAEQDTIEEAFIQQQFQHEASMASLKEAYTQGRFDRREQNIQLAGIRNKQEFGLAALQNELNQQAKTTGLQKEAAMVDSLVAMGTAQLGQAGKSTAKGVQANMASLQRSLMALDTEMSGRAVAAHLQMAELQADASLSKMSVGLNLERIDNSISNAEAEAEGNLKVMRANMQSQIRQADRNVTQIGLERKFADVNTRAGMMIKPARLPYDPEPRQPPERKFVKRLKAIPGFVPSAQQENLWSAYFNQNIKLATAAAGVATGAAAVGDAGGLGNLVSNFFKGTPGAGQGSRPGGF